MLALTLGAPAQAQTPPSAAPVTAPETPTAEPSGQNEALRQFRAAKDLYNVGAFAEAAEAFAASYAAAASPEAAFNAARAHDKGGDEVATMTWLRRYIASAAPDDASYPQAQQRAQELRARLGELRLQLDSTDELREIRVNGEVVTLADFPKLVTPGRVELRLFGAEPGEVADMPGEVAAGGTWTVQFTGFVKPPAPAPAPAPPRVLRPDPTPTMSAPRRARPLAVLFWTGTGLTTASAITMGVFAGLVLRKHTGYPDCVQARTCMTDRDSFLRYQKITNVMVGVTSGLAVITLALGLAALRERKAGREPTNGRVRVTLDGVQVAF